MDIFEICNYLSTSLSIIHNGERLKVHNYSFSNVTRNVKACIVSTGTIRNDCSLSGTLDLQRSQGLQGTDQVTYSRFDQIFLLLITPTIKSRQYFASKKYKRRRVRHQNQRHQVQIAQPVHPSLVSHTMTHYRNESRQGLFEAVGGAEGIAIGSSGRNSSSETRFWI